MIAPGFSFALLFALAASLLPQSGATRTRGAGREYGVNLTFAVYQFDDVRSPKLEPVTRLSATFTSGDEEAAYLREKYKIEDVSIRHVRSVGLANGEGFTDAVLLGPEYMVFTVTATEAVRGQMKLGMKVKYANAPLLEVAEVVIGNYETVLLRGGRGMFGLKQYIGAGGRQETAPNERALLLSVTPEVVPVTSLKNRPEQLSHPLDEYGATISMAESDRFTPPVALERIVPRFEAGRRVQGSVLLGGIVTPEGKIINVRVLRSLDPEIDQRAVEAFRQYRFSPALLNGKSVNASYREELTFADRQPTLREIQEELRKQREEREKREGKPPNRRRRWPFPIAAG
jgi:TonB family protein